jgi:hypothetical protein
MSNRLFLILNSLGHHGQEFSHRFTHTNRTVRKEATCLAGHQGEPGERQERKPDLSHRRKTTTSAILAVTGTLIVSIPVQAQWSIQDNVQRRLYPNCKISTPSRNMPCIGTSVTIGQHSMNLHFDISSVPERGLSFIINEPPQDGNAFFIGIADSRRNLIMSQGNCRFTSRSVECLSGDGQYHAKAWE